MSEVKKPLKIVFLDMDGVLCTLRACIAAGDTKGIFSYLDPIACQLLLRILERQNAKLVISSSWRQLHTFLGFRALLSANCPKLGNYIYKNYDAEEEYDWRTKSLPGQRGNEIQEWLTRHPDVTDFVILDDDSDMAHLMDRLVKTDHYDGLCFRDFQKACAILNGGKEEDLTTDI